MIISELETLKLFVLIQGGSNKGGSNPYPISKIRLCLEYTLPIDIKKAVQATKLAS